MVESYDLTSERAVMETAIEAFSLSPATRALFALETGGPINAELLKLHGNAKDRLTTKYLDFPYHSLAWTSAPEGNFIYGILRDAVPGQGHGSSLPAWIQHNRAYLATPLLLPYLACFLAADFNGSMLLESTSKLRILEQKSGHHIWAEGDNFLKNVTMGGELTALAKEASGLAATAVSRKADASSIQIATRSIIKEHLRTKKRDCDEPESLELYECLKVLEGMLESQIAFAEEYHQRALIQQTAIFQLTAQRDQGLSLKVATNSHTIAVQSRRDTVSMEAIAFLTMLILPGAFTAVSGNQNTLPFHDLTEDSTGFLRYAGV